MRLAILAASAALFAAHAALADTVQIFDLSGTFATGESLSGTVTIDTTTGLVTKLDAIVGTPLSLTFTKVSDQFSEGPPFPQWELDSNAKGNELALVFDSTSLVGYTGGLLGSYADNTYEYDSDLTLNGSFYSNLLSGSATLPGAATPEPSSIALLGTGLLGFAGALRRRLIASSRS